MSARYHFDMARCKRFIRMNISAKDKKSLISYCNISNDRRKNETKKKKETKRKKGQKGKEKKK